MVHVFVASWNRVSMMLEECLRSPGIEVWSDASGGWGCGAMWGDRWFQVAWKDWTGLAGASIAVKGLLPIIIAAAIWGMWRGKIVLCHCDNQSVHGVSCMGGYCRSPSMAQMLRCLFFSEAKFDVTLSTAHVPGEENGPADSLSGNKLSSFCDLVLQARTEPSPVPGELVICKRPLDHGHLERLARDLANNSLASSTKHVYASGQKRYLEFCQCSSLTLFPLAEDQLCSFAYISFYVGLTRNAKSDNIS